MGTPIVELITDLAEITPPIKPLLLKSLKERIPELDSGSDFKNETKVEDFEEILHQASDQISEEEFKGATDQSFDAYYYSVLEASQEHRKLTNVVFFSSITLIIIGALIILFTVITSILQSTTPLATLILQAGSALLSDIIGASLFSFYKKLVSKTDVYSQQLGRIIRQKHTIDHAINIIERIDDPHMKDEFIADLIQKILSGLEYEAGEQK
jgi:hypothetical protein